MYRWCTLVIDAMSVKQQIDFDTKTRKMVGFLDLGDGADALEEAKEVLVFMIVGLKGHWKIPIAYFFTRSLTAQVQCQLVLHALEYLHDIGHFVTGITMDGHATNVAMCHILGCDFDPFAMKTSFIDPASQRKLYVMFDACHMLKLVRNMLESYQLLQSEDGKVSWSFIKEIQSIQVYIYQFLCILHFNKSPMKKLLCNKTTFAYTYM